MFCTKRLQRPTNVRVGHVHIELEPDELMLYAAVQFFSNLHNFRLC